MSSAQTTTEDPINFHLICTNKIHAHIKCLTCEQNVWMRKREMRHSTTFHTSQFNWTSQVASNCHFNMDSFAVCWTKSQHEIPAFLSLNTVNFRNEESKSNSFINFELKLFSRDISCWHRCHHHYRFKFIWSVSHARNERYRQIGSIVLCCSISIFD